MTMLRSIFPISHVIWLISLSMTFCYLVYYRTKAGDASSFSDNPKMEHWNVHRFLLLFMFCNESTLVYCKWEFLRLIVQWLSIPFYIWVILNIILLGNYNWSVYHSHFVSATDNNLQQWRLLWINRKSVFIYSLCMFNYWLFIKRFSPANTYVFITQRSNTWRAHRTERKRVKSKQAPKREICLRHLYWCCDWQNFSFIEIFFVLLGFVCVCVYERERVYVKEAYKWNNVVVSTLSFCVCVELKSFFVVLSPQCICCEHFFSLKNR